MPYTYDMLQVRLEEERERGESFYNAFLEP